MTTQTRPDDPMNVIQGIGEPDGPYPEYDGLTKREYFAAKAMEGMLSANPKIHTDPNSSIKDWCNRSVKYADTLIKELNK